MPRIERDRLATFAEELIVALDAPPNNAAAVADSLVAADLRGHSSHGVRLLASKYAGEIADGRIDPSAEPSIERTAGAWAQVDGNLAYGQIVGRTAVDAAAERAREHGVGLAALKRTSHIGRVGEFAERACEAGMAFAAYVCNPGSAWVAPPGSAHRRFSTNPIAIGLPTFEALEFPFVADIATSQVAYGKISERAASGERLPKEWLIDDSGEDLTDGTRFISDGEGAILPLGGRTAGYKGFNLSFMSELMAANVADGSASGMEDPIWGNHAVFFLVDLETVTTRERAAERAAAAAAYVRSSDFSADLSPGAAAKGEETLLPGEAEHRTLKRHLEEGIPFSEEDAASLATLARERGVDDDRIPDAFR